MRRPHAALAAAVVAVLAAAALVAPADAKTEGLVARTRLHPVPTAGQFGATGGIQAYFRVRGDGSSVQGFRVWVDGVLDADGFEDATGATLWMAKPGDVELEQVAELATFEGMGVYEVTVDSNRDVNDTLPLGVTRILDLLRAPVEVRVPNADLEDVAALSGSIGVFRFRAVDSPRGRRSALRRPPEPAVPPDADAQGLVQLWRLRRREAGEVIVESGMGLIARGLSPDAEYEVWIEDEAGDLAEVDETTTTAEGQAVYHFAARDGDTIPPEIGADDVRELYGRRVELRRSGEEQYSLAGLFPRVR